MKSLQTTHYDLDNSTKGSSSQVMPGLLAISLLLLVIPAVEAVMLTRVLLKWGAWTLLCEELLVLGLLAAFVVYKANRFTTTRPGSAVSEEKRSYVDLLVMVVVFAILHHALFNVISAYQDVIFPR